MPKGVATSVMRAAEMCATVERFSSATVYCSPRDSQREIEASVDSLKCVCKQNGQNCNCQKLS